MTKIKWIDAPVEWGQSADSRGQSVRVTDAYGGGGHYLDASLDGFEEDELFTPPGHRYPCSPQVLRVTEVNGLREPIGSDTFWFFDHERGWSGPFPSWEEATLKLLDLDLEEVQLDERDGRFVSPQYSVARVDEDDFIDQRTGWAQVGDSGTISLPRQFLGFPAVVVVREGSEEVALTERTNEYAVALSADRNESWDVWEADSSSTVSPEMGFKRPVRRRSKPLPVGPTVF